MGLGHQQKQVASSRKLGSVSVGRRKARRFSASFKREAVKRVLDCGESMTKVAEELGVARTTLGRWRRELTPVVHTETAAAHEWVPIELEAVVATFAPEPWEQTSLRSALRGESETSDWSSLLADSIVFQRDRIGEIERLQDEGSDSGSDPGAGIDDLVCEAAVSLSLINDTQAAIDRMIHASRMDVAKQLSGFRAELRQDLSEVIDRIGADAFRRAQDKARAMGAFWRRVEPVLRTVAIREDEAPVPQPIVQGSRSPRIRRQRNRTRRTEARDRTKLLLLGLVAAGLLWLTLGIPRYEPKTVPRLPDDPNAVDRIAQAPPETLEERLSGRIPGRRLWKAQPSERSPAE